MNTTESKDTIRKITDTDGEFLVSFMTHDAYFTVTDDTLKQKLRAAKEAGTVITFTYDRDLHILKIA